MPTIRSGGFFSIIEYRESIAYSNAAVSSVTEKKILTKLSEKQERLRLRSLELDRREEQLKSLQENIQRQFHKKVRNS